MVIYLPLKAFKTKNRIVYLSRQSNDKSMDMKLLESQLKKELPNVEQVFRLRMIPDDFAGRIKYCIDVLGDMYYLSTSKLAILDTYSITVSCLNHKKSLKVIQMWHAMGAIKKFGLQSVGTKEGRNFDVSQAMCMHKNYDYIIAPSRATARFYMDAFGYAANSMKIASLPRVDNLVKQDDDMVQRFYKENPSLVDKKIVLYLPTFRNREAYITQMLITEFEDMPSNYKLIISPHPLFSKTKVKKENSYNGNYSTSDLIKLSSCVITDYSACAFEAAVLMKPLYFFVPDYKEYKEERGLNIDLEKEMDFATFESAQKLCSEIMSSYYDINRLTEFRNKYVENISDNNSCVLAKFIAMIIDKKEA